MTFAWPYMLLLVIAPVLILLLEWNKRRGLAAPARDLPHIRRGTVEGGRVRFHAAGASGARIQWRFWSAVLLVILALARPQWGPAPQATDAQSGEVLIALDLSRSMLAKDVAPSRLERGRAIAAQLAEDLRDQKIGLLTFAGTAHLLAPPADDRSLFNGYLPNLLPDHVLDQGTNLASLLEVAAAAFSPKSSQRRLVIISDGEAESDAWRDRLADLRARNIAVIAIGVGTPAGAIITGADGRPLLDGSGTPVFSRLDVASLREIAGESGGEYLDEKDAAEAAVVAGVGYGTAFDAALGSSGSRRADRFSYFLIAAVLMLAWSARSEWRARPKIRRAADRSPLAAAAGLAALVVLGALQPRIATATELHEEDDPLEIVNEIVAKLIERPSLGASDYLAFAEAATRYGEVQRGLAQPLSEGVLRDGLVAVERGRRLDPSAADWQGMAAKLRRLLVPPPPIRDEGAGPPDPASERVDAKREVPVVDPNDPQKPEAGGKSEEAKGFAEKQSLKSVGGSRRDDFEAAEWRSTSLAMPLYQLERIRGTASPAELFKLMQQPPADDGETQVW